MNGLPYFAFYASDFLSGVAAMPLEDRGAYITLLCHQWVNCSIPDDASACVRICGGGTVSERVLDKFQNVPGTGTRLNARLEKEREKCISAKEKAKKRKNTWKERARNAFQNGSRTVPDTSQERSGSDSDSDSHSSKMNGKAPGKPKRLPKAARAKEYGPDVEAMVAAYPNVPSVKDAATAWDNTTFKPVLETILASIEANKRNNPQWMRDGGRYIPALSVWINQRRWEAKIPQPVQTQNTDQELF